MVATPALIQGINYPSIRFVVFHGGSYGLISYYQGAGRGGRGGSRCDVFTVLDLRNSSTQAVTGEDLEANQEWEAFVLTRECRLRITTSCFDGHPATCQQIEDQQVCDNCAHPQDNGILEALALRALQGPTQQASTNKRPLEAELYGDREEGNSHHLWKRPRTVEVHSEPPSIPDGPQPHTGNNSFFSQKKLRPLEPMLPLPTRNLGHPGATQWQGAIGPKEVGPAIVQGAFLNRQPVEEMRKKSHRLNKIMPAMQGICPACFILTGKRVKSLPVGSKGAGADESQHIPFKHCQFPQSRCPNMWEFISFRKMIKLKGGFHYCFSCGMPQNKNRNGLEPKCHEDWGENCSRAKLNTPVNPGTLVKGVCPWSGIIQASLFALFHDKMAMKALKEPPIGLQDPDQMSLAQWASWLNKDESEKGEYWKGLEVFLFKMAEYGYKGI